MSTDTGNFYMIIPSRDLRQKMRQQRGVSTAPDPVIGSVPCEILKFKSKT